MKKMGFMSSYKQLEKLCGEIMNDERKVSAYIDEMTQTPDGAYLVAAWEEDLRKLKEYRHIRNQIVHDPGCSEENMCIADDTIWLDQFYWRIIRQEDPLALYRQAANLRCRRIAKPTQPHTPQFDYLPEMRPERSGGYVGGLAVAVVLAVITIVLLYIW